MKTYSYSIHDNDTNFDNIDIKGVLAEIDLTKIDDEYSNANYNEIENDNPYIEMLKRIKEKNSNLIEKIKKQIKENEKLSDQLVESIAGLIIGSIMTSIAASILLNPIFLGLIPIVITNIIVKNIKLKNNEKSLNCKYNLLNQYNQIITTKINIFKKIDSLELNKEYDINKIIDGELQHNYNLDRIYNLKNKNSSEDYQKINKLLEKAKIENTVYLDFFKAKDIENKKQLSDEFILKNKQNLLENNEQKQITTLEMPKEPIGFTIEPTNEEEKTYQKTKKFPN